MRPRGAAWAAAIVAALTIGQSFAGEGDKSMSGQAKLGWEWRADRTLEQRAALRIERVVKERGGLFGIGRAPSLAGSLPDARRVAALVLTAQGEGPAVPGGPLDFRIPGVELQGAEAGRVVGVGIIGNAVVCLTPAPDGLSEEGLADWLAKADCG